MERWEIQNPKEQLAKDDHRKRTEKSAHRNRPSDVAEWIRAEDASALGVDSGRYPMYSGVHSLLLRAICTPGNDYDAGCIDLSFYPYICTYMPLVQCPSYHIITDPQVIRGDAPTPMSVHSDRHFGWVLLFACSVYLRHMWYWIRFYVTAAE